jgi:hypothetical protein
MHVLEGRFPRRTIYQTETQKFFRNPATTSPITRRTENLKMLIEGIHRITINLEATSKL